LHASWEKDINLQLGIQISQRTSLFELKEWLLPRAKLIPAVHNGFVDAIETPAHLPEKGPSERTGCTHGKADFNQAGVWC
jgi:hypothetical protein